MVRMRYASILYSGADRQWGALVAVLLLAAVLWGGGCQQRASDEVSAETSEVFEQPLDTSQLYTHRPSEHSDGTGRFYLGREIAPVMGHRAADWLERPEREKTELPGRVVRALDLSPSDVVADIGAGTGYFTFRLASEVPHGQVYAVDIQTEMLAVVRQRIEERDIDNVAPVLGTPTDPNLPAERVDVALLVDAYHEFSHPYEMIQGIAEALRPGGCVVLVEYRGEDATLPVKPLHKMTEAQAQKEMAAVGLVWERTKDILPRQHFMVFRKPSE